MKRFDFPFLEMSCICFLCCFSCSFWLSPLFFFAQAYDSRGSDGGGDEEGDEASSVVYSSTR